MDWIEETATTCHGQAKHWMRHFGLLMKPHPRRIYLSVLALSPLPARLITELNYGAMPISTEPSIGFHPTLKSSHFFSAGVAETS